MTPFTDPYHASPNRIRLQTWVDRDSHNFLRSLHPDKGTIEITINTLHAKLITALKKAHITQLANHQDYERAIAEFTIEIPNRPESGRGTTKGATRKTR